MKNNKLTSVPLVFSMVFTCQVAISQNSFPSSGMVQVGSSGVITPNHPLEVYSTTTAGKHLGIGGVSPCIDFYGGTTSYSGHPPTGSQFAKVALATVANHFMNGSNPGDLIIQTMGTNSLPLPAGSDGRSILFSSHYDGIGNGVEHMRINEDGRVGIGTYNVGTGALDRSKFRVAHFDYDGQGILERFGTQSSIMGVNPICSDCYQAPLIGVHGEATTVQYDSYQLKGVQGKASGGLNNWGGNFESSTGCEHYRVKGAANFGIQAKASGNWNTYGVWAEATCAFANQFAVWSNGQSYSTGSWLSSDKNLKQDIKPLNSALDKIMKLKPSTYTYKTSEFASMNLPEGSQVGLIAQELEAVFPEMVMQIHELTVPDEKGGKVMKNPDFKAVNYVQLIPVLIKGMQEQQDKIYQQEQQISELKAFVASVLPKESNLHLASTDSKIPVDGRTIVLNQNSPNPFAEKTIISYNIPESFSKATIIFSNTQGEVLKTIDIVTSGKGNLNVYGNDLTNGVYSYILIVDGKIIDGKKMIKE